MIVTRNLLRSEVQREALKQFVHRYTGQHRPAWSLKPMPNRRPYPVQFRDDRDWLEHTLFHVTKNGELDKRFKHCQSSPTWPFNPELR